MTVDAQIASLLGQIHSSVARRSTLDNDAVQEAVDQLMELGKEHGLNGRSIGKAYELVLGGSMPTPPAFALLPALIPREPLALRPVLLTLSSLGETSHARPPHAGKVDYKVQRRALEQLAVLMELGAVGKEGTEALDRLFGVVERGLDYRMLRDPTAALLCQIARRHHVQPHRINALQTLIRQLDSPSAALFRLADHYRSFQPEHVYEQRGKGKKDRGTALEEWKETAKAVLEAADEAGGDERESKRRKLSSKAYIPLPTTYTTDLTAPSALPLSDISNLPSLAANLDTLALPSQAASVLSAVSGSAGSNGIASEEEQSRAWALLLRCGYDDDHLHRLSTWLIAQLQHELYDLEPSAERTARVEDLLCRLRELCEMGGELLEPLEAFLAEYLLRWDGASHRKVVFDLVALLKPLDWDGLYGHFLCHLERLAATATAEWVADYFDCLASLILHLAVRDDWEEETSRTTVFGRLDDSGPYLQSLQHLLNYSDALIASATLRFPASLTLRCSAFSLYETAYTLPLAHNLPVTILPSVVFTYSTFLSNDVMSVSRACGLIVRVRQVLTGPNSAITKDDPENADLVTALNVRLIDFVNALWQKKFLVGQGNGGTLGLSGGEVDLLRLVGDRRGQVTGSSQGLAIHAALAPLAKECFLALAEQQGRSAAGLVGPVSASALKHLSKDPSAPPVTFNEFRPTFLEYLHAKGAEGIHDFLFGSLQSLIQRRVSMGGEEGRGA
ncbi:hypothetical protein JCM6882_003460 [Rhodosporidiobolus microsporus]